jgi:hypothetical protein
LPTQKLRLVARFFFAARQFSLVDNWSCGYWRFEHLSRLWHRIRAIFPAHKGALFTHFHLDGAGLAAGIGLFDFRGLLLDQRNFFTLRTRSAMGSLQVVQQHMFIRVGQHIAGSGFGDPSGFQLIQQGFGRFLEFTGKLGDSRTGHLAGNLSWP